jgi:hypothetical protein
MKGVTRWRTVLATAALVALPALAVGETAHRQTSMSSTVPDRLTAAKHLREAKQSLDLIMTASLDQQVRPGIVDLKTQFAKLERDYRSGGSSSSMGMGTSGGTSGTSGSTTSTPPSPDAWMSDYKDIDRSLDALIGPSRMRSSPSSPGASDTTGTSGSVTLDPTVKRNLESFRMHMEAFAKAAGYSDTHTSASTTSASGDQLGAWSSGSTAGTSGVTWSGTSGAIGTSGKVSQEPSQSRLSTTTGAEYYLSQIETIVDQALGSPASSAGGTTGTTGSMTPSTVTIDRARLEQIRANVEQVRKLIGGPSH